MEADGTIEPIKDRSTEFCTPTIFLLKPDDTSHFAVDFNNLNKKVLRTVYLTLSSRDVIHLIDPIVKYFSIFDCPKCYWQVPLSE